MMGEGRGGVAPPPLEIGKKDAVRGNFNLFHLFFTYEIRGGIDTLYKQSGRVGGQTRVHSRGGRRGLAPPPLKMEKNVVRRNFNLFHLCFTNEIGGDRQTLAAYMQNGRGWADRRLSMVGGGGGEGALPPPPRK